MSHVAIAAALALEDVSAGERLVAFSLASFANREHHAWPGTRIATVRAGLSRSRYLAARESLQSRGLVVVEESRGGRGNSPIVTLLFAQTGPWFEGEINAELFEITLGYSRARGSARLLLATLAAVADEQLEVSGFATDEIQAAAGMADTTYRRARTALLASGELVLDAAGGGRARTNRWLLRNPREMDAEPALATRTRVAPSGPNRPLIGTAKNPGAVRSVGDAAAAAPRAVAKGPGSSGVSGGVSGLNPARSRTVSSETPPQTPSETPPPNARAGREPQNPRTIPPSPPGGGSLAGSVTIVEDYVTDRGRKRQRPVVVDLDEIRSHFREPDDGAQADWERIRSELRRAVGDSTFEIWLDQLELRATDQTGSLLVSSAPATGAWVAKRFGGLLEQVARPLGRQLRLATDRELQLLDAISPSSSAADASPLFSTETCHDQKEAV